MKLPFPGAAFLERSWRPLLAVLIVLSLEAGIRDAGWLRHEPLINMSVPPSTARLRIGAVEVDIRFGRQAWPSTLNVSLTSTSPGRTEGDIDVTNLFVALENGAVGTLSGLAEGRYTLRARVFGHPRGRDDLLIEEDVSVDLVVPSLPDYDRA